MTTKKTVVSSKVMRRVTRVIRRQSLTKIDFGFLVVVGIVGLLTIGNGGFSADIATVNAENDAIQEKHATALHDSPPSSSSSPINERKRPVQVYIMMGQSNMLGLGKVDTSIEFKNQVFSNTTTVQHLVKNNPDLYRKYGRYVDNDDQEPDHRVSTRSSSSKPKSKSKSYFHWEERSNVRYVEVVGVKDTPLEQDVSRNEWLSMKKRRSIGPEIGLGWILDDDGHDDDRNNNNDDREGGDDDDDDSQSQQSSRILLLKACIGNRALGWDLLPPGSPRILYDGEYYAGYGESPDHWTAEEQDEDEGLVTVNKTSDGWYAGLQYDEDVSNAKQVLADIGTYFPGAHSDDYEIAGFFWFQGHRDTITPAHARYYKENLIRLVQSLRADFKAPSAPFVIGSIGFYGYNMSDPNMLSVFRAQMDVSNELDQVKSIDTRPFWVNETMTIGSPFTWIHYGFSGEFQLQVGSAMGSAMQELHRQEQQMASIVRQPVMPRSFLLLVALLLLFLLLWLF